MTLSAKTEKALEELAQCYVNYLESDLNTELADICFTANTGREHFNYRWAVVEENKKQFQEQLINLIGFKPKPQSLKTTSKQQIAFLFTGQGSQYAGMGRQLYETQPTFRKIINRCDEILRPYLEQPLLSVLYPDNQSDHSKLDETAYTQPALFALEYALAQLWKSWGIEPDVVMGHSIGEYVAACVAGVLTLEDGLKLIATRGKLMQALPQDGEMVALSASEAQAQEAISPYSTSVSIAAINAPESVVISGQREAINAICATLEASGIKTKKLNVSHAFHSPLMESMLGEFERVAQQVNFSSPQIKLISNVTGKEATLEITTPDYWCRHVRQPVQFARCIQSLEEQEIDVFVEIGAKPILLGMARQCLPEHMGLWLPSLRPDREDWQELLSSLAQLYVHGVPVDWVGFNQDYTRRRVQLPTYPFQRQRYWVEAPKDNGTKALVLTNTPTSSRQHPLLGQKIGLLGTKQIHFQCQIRKNFPNWLQDYRVFESTIVPGTAYIEMALAAGVAVGKTERIAVENVVIQKALILPDDGSEKIIQLVLTPQENLDYTFEIFSFKTTPNEDNEEPQGILHASGILLVKDKQFQGETIDLATLKSQCQEEVSPEVLYQRNEEQNINYGESFRALDKVWRQGTVALGKISLPEKLRAQGGDYQLHPVLLDASLQVLDATLLEDNYQNTYVPSGVERLLFYSQKSVDIWCYAQLHPGEDRSQKTISADFRLFAEDGELIALVEGFQLKHAPRDAMLGTQEKFWQDWLYEVEWRPQARYGLFPNYLPSSAEVGLRLSSRLAELMAHPSLTAYGQAYAHLEASCVTYIMATLQEMGWEFQQGTTFSTEQIAERLSIVTQHKRLLNRLLEILVEVGILQRFEEGWEVVSSPEIQDSIAKIDSLYYPEAEAEITLLERCASNLAQVLTGKCDPLQLLFPNSDTTALIKLYQDSPIMQVTNTLVKEAVLSARERLPQGRGLRILEIGAGTGSTTNYLLPHLFAHQTEYVFTDIGAFFIAKAQERFKDYPFVSYQVLDIEKDPQSQGFEPSHFDLIVAVNVLHATSDLRSSLQHVKQLLVPGGMLVLMEETAPQRWVDLTFGLTEGWWKFSDRDLRHNYPLLTPQRWRELLLKTGFSQVETISTNLEASHPAILLPQETVIVALSEAESQISTPRNWLILADTQGTGQQLGEIMRSWGEVCTLVFQSEEYEQIASGEFRINPANPSHFRQLLQAIPTVAGVVHLWSLDVPEILSVTDLEKTSKTSCGSTLHLVQELVKNYTETPRLWLVTRGAQAVNGHHVHRVAQSPLWGMGKVIALEHPELKCVRVDLDPLATGNDTQILFEEIISSLWAEGTCDQVAFRARERYVPRLVHHRQSQKTLGQMSLRSDGTYLITGGLGGLGLLVAQWLVERGAKHLVLLSRSGQNPSASDQLEKLEQAGACVKVAQADVSDSKQLNCVWSEIEGTLPPLRGIIHAAGVLDDGVLLQLHWQRFERVLAPKVQGAWNLHTLTQNKSLDFFVLFSSATSLLGNAGQANHAAANAFLDALASNRRMLGLPGLSINWGAWAEVGAAARMGLVEHLSLKGEESIAPKQGLQVLEQLLLNPPVQVGVMPVNWSRFLQQRKALSPFFTDLAAEIQQLGFRSTSVTPQEGDSLKNALLSRTPAERQQLLESRITEQVARVLGFSATKFDRQESLINLGLDSLMAIELRNRLNSEMGVNLPVMKIMEGVSISSLAEVMLEQWALAQLQSASPSTELDDSIEEIAL